MVKSYHILLKGVEANNFVVFVALSLPSSGIMMTIQYAWVMQIKTARWQDELNKNAADVQPHCLDI